MDIEIGLEKIITKFFEVIGKGIGKVYEPIYIERIAKSRAKEIEIVSKTINNNIDVPIKYENDGITIDSSSTEGILKRANIREKYNALRKQINIDSIIVKAYNEFDNEEYITNQKVDQDWVLNFFNNAGNISDEHIQKIWSKILIGEIKNPNTYTLRTLNILKNMTSFEANLYEKIIPFIFYEKENPFIYNDIELLEKYGLEFNELIKLEDCGLISLNVGVSINFKDIKNYIYNKNYVIVINGEKNLGIYRITESGKQILNLIKNNICSNDKYFLEIGEKLKKDNSGILINAYKIYKYDKNGIEYDDENDILSN